MADYDVIVIGSGAGGLAAAVALARAGKKVAVFEQHYLPGGWSQSFTLEGHTFSPGIHYVGELGPEGGLRRLYEGLGVAADLSFARLNPDAFEHLRAGQLRFDVPAGRTAFVARLKERFSAHAKAIDAYFDLVEGMYAEIMAIPAVYSKRSRLDPRGMPLTLRYGWRSFSRLLDHFFDDPELRAVLSFQAGDHGMPLTRVPAVVQTSITAHYLDGGYYPVGGAKALPSAFIKQLRHHGGEIHVRTEVDRILIVDGRAQGVRLADGSEVSAGHVVSNADPGVTWGRLVDAEHQGRIERWRTQHVAWSCSSLGLFVALDGDPRTLGFDSGNLWWSRSSDIDAVYRLTQEKDLSALEHFPGLYIGCSSLKDPKPTRTGQHTFEIFSFVHPDAFARWFGSSFDDRPPDYLAFKERLTGRMFAAVEEAVPGFRERVTFSSLGTPVSNQHFVHATKGSIYGTERLLRNMGPWGQHVRSSIPGLLLCGASTLCHGVYGATLSGLLAAQIVLDCALEDLLEPKGPGLQVVELEG